MFNNSLSGKDIDFKTFEKLVFKFVCKLGCIIIKYLLELCDKQLMHSRDKKAYRHKGYKRNCIKTIMGPKEFKRVVYEHTDERGMPFNGSALTEGMRVVRRFIDGNAVTDLV